ncbi:Beta-barrel assembly machine subunit BamC [Luteimonas cucumeris]|uniref:Beta-barrel assembly machine subunit BamC n=1 Tax=Luteimonas cucumeris TaxID=985012 RepID=A0A562LAQ3_9GAMM|nr:hypothetical protein [Luteimonas cucumeris]TWI04749.1 Beta-barrel assembly machine subunit BamC [Luteimonas cucumeris]
MRHLSVPSRNVAVALLAVAIVGASGCSWFRKDNEIYKQSAESRPLEIPPDLDRPNTEAAMNLPASVTASQVAAQRGSANTASPVGFATAGTRDEVFARIGEVLAATSGVTVVSKAQLLGTYDVDFEGSKFLVRVAQSGDGAYVSAVDPRGLPATGPAPAKLMAALKAGLSG